MKKHYVILMLGVFSLLFNRVSAQSPEQGDLLLTLGADVYRTNMSKAFERVSVGADLSYFLVDRITLGAGVDHMSYFKGGSTTYWTLQTRLYAYKTLFFRFKTLKFDEFLIGTGYDFMFNETVALATNADYYLKGHDFAIRIGLAFYF